jgi:cellulose synthase/poly-beta-1,6-N-acetylglucosamine synthase-like glycosyltransferase
MLKILNNFLIIIFSTLLIMGLMIYIYRMILNGNTKRWKAKCKAFLVDPTNNPRLEKKLLSRWKIILETYISINQSLKCQGERLLRMAELFGRWKVDIRLIKKLMDGSKYQRCRSAHALGYIPTEAAKRSLIVALEREKNEVVKLYLANAITSQDISAALPSLIDSLRGSSKRYRRQLAGFILNFRSSFMAYFPVLAERQEMEVQELIIRFAAQAPSDIFLQYLKKIMDSTDLPIIRIKAFRCLVNTYSHGVDPLQYLLHKDPEIVEQAIMGLGYDAERRSLAVLVRILSMEKYTRLAQKSLSNLISRSPQLISEINRCYVKSDNAMAKKALINVAAERLEYFLPKIKDDKTGRTALITKEVLKAGYMSSLISFLNANKDRDLENFILTIIQRAMEDEELSSREMQYYLNQRILTKIGLKKLPIPVKRINEKNESVPLRPLYFIMITSLLTVPVLFGIHLWRLGNVEFWLNAITITFNEFLIGFGIYGLLLNGIYLLLFLLGFINSRKQDRFRKLKSTTMLFQPWVLPSLSIVVPAYGEEDTIIENVNSLLNLRYPTLEVIVVNDGSPDNTMGVLIEHFQLRKEDKRWEEKLQTQPVRGIYMNPNIPELTIIDKINGGKADTLNVGINFAQNDYFVGIDSDSLLERDSLLEVMGLFLDEDKPVVAAGGNIMPINGCTVDRGVLEKKRVSKHPLAFLQTIEYLRSFMNGRMGWAEMDALLIISGAFGVFKRKEVIEVGGYLTSSGKFLKDTVGEDMELVVRLHNNLTDQGKPFAVRYAAAANCWTEVPVSLKILGKQRDRWQRGLLDILSFHKKMIFNPKYGGAGMLAFPYFLIFETIGPWFELQATILLIVGLSLGWISSSVLIFTLLANFAISAFLSLCAMVISDWQGSMFTLPDRLLLAAAALIETLGFRQMMSFYRISGYINTLKKKTGWGKMTRQGFSSKK